MPGAHASNASTGTAGVIIVAAIGIPIGLLMPMTAVPQRTALSHSFGGFAVGVVGTAKFYMWSQHDPEKLTTFTMAVLSLEVLLGFLTFTGSLMAFGKLVRRTVHNKSSKLASLRDVASHPVHPVLTQTP